jgi:hypothetical protein
MTATVAPRPDTVKGGNKRWHWIRHEGVLYYDLGRNPDGSIHNPRGHPADIALAAVEGAEERGHLKRSNAARKAAETRRKRTEKRTYEVARRIVDGEVFGPADSCFICGKGLGDPESKQRGIGSDCWQAVLDCIEPAAP